MTDQDIIPGDDSSDDRRRDNRTTAVYRPVLLETEGFTGFCLLRNLSPSGMMGIAYASFAEGQPVSVQFMPGHVVTGTIIWSRDERVGVRFDEEIDLAGSLKNMGSTYVESGLNRAPRLQIDCEGEAVVDDARWTIRIQDISQRGIKTTLPMVRPGKEVTILLPGMEPRKAIVRWAQNDIVGLNFVRPIAFEELARWAIYQQSGGDERLTVTGCG
ncbi:MAG: PilZ domain-containing protein [Candidatus Andeanibacterium colombiense]|uniref:PilZ domain-containing protein n=1 Tax=Candidatus Andeanibacterium colombiense TaxID=3121345 RepID=A0AAJ5X853_9SPHN|nr:MAG: PilZ domain-containing protein [Sphingomonadaceae bacterium]